MQAILIILYAYALITGSLLYIMLFGQTEFHKNGIVGKLHNLVTKLPKTCLSACCGLLCGNKGNNTCANVENYFCHSKNPVLQLVYIGLLSANVVLYFYNVFPMIPNAILPAYHKVIAVVTIIGAYASFLKASFSNPGVITKKNYEQFADTFPCDNAMYAPNKICKTCGIIKPPRSKHCSMYNQCVSKFDHYCIWLNNDVGELNYRWFHAFLITNFMMCFYGVYVYCMTLWSILIEKDLLNATFVAPNGQRILASPAIVMQYMLANYLFIFAQAFFLVAVSLMLLGFWLYHFYLTVYNTTTNESFKWKDTMNVVTFIKKFYTKNKGASLKKALEEEFAEKYSAGTKQRIEMLDERIKKGEDITNIYSIGFWGNIMQVISPPSLASGAKRRTTTTLAGATGSKFLPKKE